jgi:hypothetical protein
MVSAALCIRWPATEANPADTATPWAAPTRPGDPGEEIRQLEAAAPAVPPGSAAPEKGEMAPGSGGPKYRAASCESR